MNRWIVSRIKFLFGFTLLFLFISQPAHATGIRIPESSLAGLGTADAQVANPDDMGALVYNPGGMIFHEGFNVSAGVVLINPHLSVTPDGGAGQVDSDGSSIVTIPNLFYSQKLDPDWSIGVNVSSPFGLETDWPAGTFPAFAGPLAPFEPSRTKVSMVNINPTVAHRIHFLNGGLGIGVDFYQVISGVLDTQAVGIHGSGNGVGWNAGLISVQGPVSFGVAYRSEVQTNIDGTFNPSQLGSVPSSLSTEITFPDMLQVGIRYKVLPTLAVETDVERTGWHSFDQLTITHSSPGIPSPYVENPNWRNSTAYRFGVTYVVIPALTLRAGYALDITPQTDSNFSARIPDANRHSIHSGFSFNGGKWAVEGGYMYVKLVNRNINNTTPYLGGDPTGTAAFNGNYESYGHEFGITFILRM